MWEIFSSDPCEFHKCYVHPAIISEIRRLSSMIDDLNIHEDAYVKPLFLRINKIETKWRWSSGGAVKTRQATCHWRKFETPGGGEGT